MNYKQKAEEFTKEYRERLYLGDGLLLRAFASWLDEQEEECNCFGKCLNEKFNPTPKPELPEETFIYGKQHISLVYEALNQIIRYLQANKTK